MRLDQSDRIMLGDREVSLVYLGANMVRGNAFSPASLFAQGEPGVWYDPTDLSTLFQDTAGTTPVTSVEQPVGLMLDKSKGLVLGSELVVDGRFDDASKWNTGTGFSVSGGLATATAAGSGQRLVDRNPRTLLPAGAAVLVEYTVNSVSAGGFASILVADGTTVTTSAVTRSSPGTYREILIATGAFNGFGVRAMGVTTGSIDNISVRELPGNHAYQTTATARPIYRASPARIDFDAVDDALITTFPASLGSNCTIARAVPGVGAQILTGQTVGTTFSDTTDHAGLVIINRALTPSETAALTVYLNAKVAA